MNIKVFVGRLIYSQADEEGIIRKLLLLPLALLSLVYRLLVQSRQALYRGGILKRHALPCRVISIGNITLGGTGKTPTAIYLAELFKDRGMQPVVLSRGYRAKSPAAPAVVSDGSATFMDPQEAGDEPFLLSQALPGVPVIIGPNRALSGRLACEQFSPQVVILDDGFQHQKIKRDIDIVLVDRHHGFGNGYLVPRGILREPLGALGRAHILLLTKHGETGADRHLEQQIRRHNPSVPIFQARYTANSVKTFREQKEVPLDLLRGKKVLALSGIGNPHYFSFLLKQSGMRVTEEWILPDHHGYTEKDARRAHDFLSRVEYIVTTAKDSCKMDRELFGDLPLLTLEIVLRIEEEQHFKHTLFKLFA